MIGVAPHTIDQNGVNLYNKCGWYLHTRYSTLYSGPPMSFKGKAYATTDLLLAAGSRFSTVSVILDMDKKEISFIINGTNCGVAFQNIPTDVELCLCVFFI